MVGDYYPHFFLHWNYFIIFFVFYKGFSNDFEIYLGKSFKTPSNTVVALPVMKT